MQKLPIVKPVNNVMWHGLNSIAANSSISETIKSKKNNTMSKQTAVEWLIDQIVNHNGVNSKTFEQAKAMEREQLKEMYLKGIENYDPTFKRKGGEQ